MTEASLPVQRLRGIRIHSTFWKPEGSQDGHTEKDWKDMMGNEKNVRS